MRISNTIWLPAALLFAVAPAALAISCGTVANPSSCTVTVTGPGGNQLQYDFSGFSFLNNGSAGGGNLYVGGDIDIDVATGGGFTGLLSFTKHPGSPTAGIVFLANPGETAGFTFSYGVSVTPLQPGTVNVVSTTNSFNETHTNNALASVQEIIAPLNCLASTADTSNTCALSGATSFTTGLIVSLTGNTGNTGITTFQNLYDSTFTPGGAEVPEPATTALIGVGLVGLVAIGRRKRNRRVMERRRMIERLSA